MLNLVTGWDTTADELEETGERICNLERALHVREGVSRADDMLPYKVMHEPIPDGPHKGMHCPPDELEGMKNEFYGIRGWDENGSPTAATLERLKFRRRGRSPGRFGEWRRATARVESERICRNDWQGRFANRPYSGRHNLSKGLNSATRLQHQIYRHGALSETRIISATMNDPAPSPFGRD